MYDLNNQKFVVLTFATVNEFRDLKNDITVTLQRDAIAEIAAVKIESGKIQGHFHSYVAPDGYDAHDIDIDIGNYGAYGIRAEHLIGAPTLNEVISDLSLYIGDSILFLHNTSPNTHNSFSILKNHAQRLGCCFNNHVISLCDIATAARLKTAINSSHIELDSASVLQTANLLAGGNDKWTAIFADNDIYFNPESDDICCRDRNDPLTWALFFAKLFIALVEDEMEDITELEQKVESETDKVETETVDENDNA